jgi:hypothetical protein
MQLTSQSVEEILRILSPLLALSIASPQKCRYIQLVGLRLFDRRYAREGRPTHNCIRDTRLNGTNIINLDASRYGKVVCLSDPLRMRLLAANFNLVSVR